jgi:CheY-like chemotaxis protein
MKFNGNGKVEGVVPKKSLLIINHSQVLMDYFSKILEQAGYSVRCAVGIAGAKEQLADYEPDGIILDNDLPDGNVFEYCSGLREKSGVPIMFMSDKKDDELSALQAGATDFLKKPFDFEILKARIGIMLNLTANIEPEPSRGNETDGQDYNQNKGSQKNKKIFRSLSVVAAACFVFAFMGFGALHLLKSPPDIVDIPRDQVALAAPLRHDENARPYAGDTSETTNSSVDSIYSIPRYDYITVSAGAPEIQMLLFNLEGNPCYFIFEIVLYDTGETLYKSNLIGPGMCIENFTLTQTPEKGEHKAVLKTHAYELDSYTEMDGEETLFILLVE